MNAQRSVGVYQPRSRRAQLAELFAGLRVRIYAFLGVALWRFAGGSLLVISGAMLLMIAGYDAADPSLDVATGKEVANWLGKTGAFGADLLLRFLGLSALALAANSAAWGWQMISRGTRPEQPLLRAGAALSGLLLSSAGLGILPGFGTFPAGAGGVLGNAIGPLLEGAEKAWSLKWLAPSVSILMGFAGVALVLWASGMAMRVGYGLTGIGALLWRNAPRLLPGRGAARVVREAPLRQTDDLADDDLAAADEFEEPEIQPAASMRENSEALVRRSGERRRKGRVKLELQPALNLAEGEYQLPPLGLLAEAPCRVRESCGFGRCAERKCALVGGGAG